MRHEKGKSPPRPRVECRTTAWQVARVASEWARRCRGVNVQLRTAIPQQKAESVLDKSTNSLLKSWKCSWRKAGQIKGNDICNQQRKRNCD